MPRRQFNDGMEVIYQDSNKLSQAIERELYERVLYELVQRTEDAFFGDSFLVEYATPTSVTVRAGNGFQTDATVTSPEPRKRLVYRASQSTHIIDSPDASLDRIDLVVVKNARVVTATETRKYKDPSTFVISNQSLDVENDWEAEIDLIEGVPSATPVAPAVPAGYIKIAELYVTAVTGLAGSGAVTDTRDLLPTAGGILLNTLGKQRVTAGASVPLDQLIADIDALLKFGYQNYTDYDDLAVDPAAPGAGKKRFFFKGDVAYFRNQGGTTIPIGSGGGGGGGANWYPEPGNAPVESVENGEKVWLFEQGLGQKLTLWVKVPQGYLAGSQIKMYLGAYSPSSSDQWKLQTVTTLIRKNNDAVTSVANQLTANTGDITNTVANQYRELLVNLTSAIGQVNSVGVSPGDLLKIELTRIVPGGTEDTNDVRFLPSSTEVKL